MYEAFIKLREHLLMTSRNVLNHNINLCRQLGAVPKDTEAIDEIIDTLLEQNRLILERNAAIYAIDLRFGRLEELDESLRELDESLRKNEQIILQCCP